MTTKVLRSVKGRACRITRLDLCGNVVEGSCSSIVTHGFITVTLTEEVKAGDELTQENAWGELWIDEVEDDILKWVTTAIQFCEVNPDVLDIIGGATPVVVSGNTIGWTRGPNPPVGTFALEVWTKKAGQDACSATGHPEWGYFLVPFVTHGKLDGALTIEKGPLNITLTGKGFAAPASWASGPYPDVPWLDPEGFPAGEMYGGIVTTVQPPTPTTGCVALFLIGNVKPGDTFSNADFPTIVAQDGTNAGRLTALGFVVDPAKIAAWATGEFFSIGTFKFNWTGAAWAAGVHA